MHGYIDVCLCGNVALNYLYILVYIYTIYISCTVVKDHDEMTNADDEFCCSAATLRCNYSNLDPVLNTYNFSDYCYCVSP